MKIKNAGVTNGEANGEDKVFRSKRRPREH